MSINSISNSYLQFTQSQGTAGNGGSVEISYNDGVLTFTEADGDKFTTSASNLSDADIEKLSSTFGATVKSAEGESVDTDSNDDEYNDLKSSAEGKQSQIKTLSTDIKSIYTETLDEQEKVTKEEYERILGLVESYTLQFMEDRANGKNVQVADMQAALSAEVEDSDYDQKIAEAFDRMGGAQTKIQQMSTLLSELDDIGTQIKDIENVNKNSYMSEFEGLTDSEDNFFATGEATVSGESAADVDPLSYSFSLNSFMEIYQEKLSGHKTQFSMISDFKELDDNIIEMFNEFSESIGSIAQKYEVDEKEPAEEKEAEEDQEENEAIAA